MLLSVATATFYDTPFSETLRIIKQAGFEHIELDLYWQGGEHWKMAQHLEGIEPHVVVKMIDAAGLQIASIHDGSGVIENDADSAIDPSVFEYIECLSGKIDCLVLHAPHKKTNTGQTWWETYKNKFSRDLADMKQYCNLLCVENLPRFENYYVSLMHADELYQFAFEHDVFINFDTTHYAQNHVDIFEAFDTVKTRVKAIHLSDYCESKAHVYVGRGDLNLAEFIRTIANSQVHSLTLECDVKSVKDEHDIVDRLKFAKMFVEHALSDSHTSQMSSFN
jgi:sugar phosphate isomerase/epimerase